MKRGPVEDRAAPATIVHEAGDADSLFRIRIEIDVQPENWPPRSPDPGWVGIDSRQHLTWAIRKLFGLTVQAAWDDLATFRASRPMAGDPPPMKVFDPPNTSPRTGQVSKGTGRPTTSGSR